MHDNFRFVNFHTLAVPVIPAPQRALYMQHLSDPERLVKLFGLLAEHQSFEVTD